MMTLEPTIEGDVWKQNARWIKYIQVVEGDFTRFSKPYIPLLHIQALMQARNCLKKGVILLDEEAADYDSVVSKLFDHL
ncbi:hypothetical protein NECAME_14093 [Necator americanus]|uniref:Band 3 cytoplasmic domain-containing protein n=1 Tax=Necator americanus TaxID=51031 RepID=W2SSW4_NECAM|nr:hypothetical protein NECAME_14093 [Necator americanus]ETN71762.1 hypothetical protein NECAME_14093 [Necator americanus]